MSTILKYMVLPKEVTEFEEKYLKKLNKISIIFFFCHIPVFMAVAWANNTGIWFALALTTATLIGPAIAYFTLKSQRGISMVYGFTAMILGGVLVHFGQGPMQIEMHFYFFALLAMLGMFANPLVIIVAAVTVAIHHFTAWWFIPSSMFNYDASIWVVLVHAAFVVLETIAVCYISREFFDNVIGLDKIVQERTKELDQSQSDMTLVLDNIDQGFITVDLDGVMGGRTSAIVHEWFGAEQENTTFSDYINDKDEDAAVWFEMGLESVKDGILPVEVAMEQLPSRLMLGEKTMAFEYKTIENDVNEVDKILIIISDITDLIKRELAEKAQKQILSAFEHIMKDKAGFIEFLTESDQQMSLIANNEYDDLVHLKRLIHTIKGNSGIFGLTGVADVCHEMENQINEEGIKPTEAEIKVLSDTWNDMRKKLDELVSQGQGGKRNTDIQVLDADYNAILHAVIQREDSEKIESMIESWKLEPIKNKLSTLKQQAERLSKQVGKGELDVILAPNNIRIESEHWAPFWSSFIHVIRNAIDHGIESTDERIALGKTANGKLELKTVVEDERFIVSIIDDGRGINWKVLADKATKANLPNTTQKDLENALFHDGISTKDSISDISGRGVGMSAILSTCKELGGVVNIISNENQGTEIQFSFPLGKNIYQLAA
ncbi:MAG: Hpt domain-containing protein [Methylococcaceae bacterium]